ncbi:MAG: hypothetical protein CVT48_00530 [Thermoplasmata archaeon HGW-Thermoplasmata-1]|nr:MAG: hypothetical protein CVT48_00530 [Thermoplasmata archaeon HGW-Thermoplasmata-1]
MSRKTMAIVGVMVFLSSFFAGCADTDMASGDVIPYPILGDIVRYEGEGSVIDLFSFSTHDGGYYVIYGNGNGSSQVVTLEGDSVFEIEIKGNSITRWDFCRNEHDTYFAEFSVDNPVVFEVNAAISNAIFQKFYLSKESNVVVESIDKNSFCNFNDGPTRYQDKGLKRALGLPGLWDSTIFQGEEIQIGKEIKYDLPTNILRNRYSTPKILPITFKAVKKEYVNGYDCYKMELQNPSSLEARFNGQCPFYYDVYDVWVSPSLPYIVKKVVNFTMEMPLGTFLPCGIITNSSIELKEYLPGSSEIDISSDEFEYPETANHVDWSEWDKKILPDGGRYSIFTLSDAFAYAKDNDEGLAQYLSENPEWQMPYVNYRIGNESLAAVPLYDTYSWEMHFTEPNEGTYLCEVVHYYNEAFDRSYDKVVESGEDTSNYGLQYNLYVKSPVSKVDTIENAFRLYELLMENKEFGFLESRFDERGAVYTFYFPLPENASSGLLESITVSEYGKYTFWHLFEENAPKM